MARTDRARPARRKPAHRHLRADPPGLERLRQLGQQLGAARRRLGAVGAPDQLPDRHADDRRSERCGAGAVTRTGPNGRTTVGRTEGGDVYAGRDGNVYRRDEGGGWEQSNGSGGWTPTDGPGAQQARDKAATRPMPPPGRRTPTGADNSTAIETPAYRATSAPPIGAAGSRAAGPAPAPAPTVGGGGGRGGGGRRR